MTDDKDGYENKKVHRFQNICGAIKKEFGRCNEKRNATRILQDNGNFTSIIWERRVGRKEEKISYEI
jgi:hypothetical protein